MTHAPFFTLKALNAHLKAAHDVRANILTTSNPKVEKNEKLGKLGAILHLDPAFADWVCPFKGLCATGCLNVAGNPAHLTGKLNARRNRTALLENDYELFMFTVAVDIARKRRKAEKAGLALTMRLNGTSDIVWEAKRFTVRTWMLPLFAKYGIDAAAGLTVTLFDLFADVVFYDYTKVIARLRRPLPVNYHLTFSLDGHRNIDAAHEALVLGFNVAVPFYTVPARFELGGFSFEVLDGDATDYRPADPAEGGYIIGLKYKRVRGFVNNGFIVDGARLDYPAAA